MIFKNQKQKVWTIVFIIIGCVFSIFSVFIIIKVNTIRKTVEHYVSDINILSRLDAEFLSIINGIDKEDGSEWRLKIKQLISSQNLSQEIDFSNLKRDLNNAESKPDNSTLKNELVLITKSCQYAIGNNRQQLRLNSEKLLDCWNYTHLLLIIASIAFFGFPIIIYSIFNSKQTKTYLKQ